MKLKTKLAVILSVAVLSMSSLSVFAVDIDDAETDKIGGNNNDSELQEIMTVEETIKLTLKPFTGTIKDIADHNVIENSKFVNVESYDGKVANFIITDETFIFNNAEFSVGSVVTGYYDANAIMIMIYPPQYKIEVLVVEEKDQTVKVDRFDKDLVSSDNFLKLLISEETEITLEDGTAFEGELTDKLLAVSYGISTRSIPAQTHPFKVVVLAEKPELDHDVSKMDLLVNNKVIDALPAYTNDYGTVMVPLRAIAEALGFEVLWDNPTKTATVGKDISLSIGKDAYTYMKTEPIILGNAPETKDDRTFVPLSFFKEVVRMNNAYVFENQIVIDNEEPVK